MGSVTNPMQTQQAELAKQRAGLSPGQIADTVLHDVIMAGILAASIFVKNPNSQQKAATLISLVQQLLPALDNQLNGGARMGLQNQPPATFPNH